MANSNIDELTGLERLNALRKIAAELGVGAGGTAEEIEERIARARMDEQEPNKVPSEPQSVPEPEEPVDELEQARELLRKAGELPEPGVDELSPNVGKVEMEQLSRATKELLDKEPTERIMIPLDPLNPQIKVVEAGLNGRPIVIPRDTPVDAPESVVHLLSNSDISFQLAR